MTAPLPHVTDHAVLRYLERVRGMDIEAVRRHIAALCAGAVACGAICYRAEGHRFTIADRTVVTVRPMPGKPSRPRGGA